MRPSPRRASRPLGSPTRGTTNPNRLRRLDRWMAAAHAPLLHRAPRPLVVDLGYGASAVTAVELHGRLRAVRPDVEVLGLEIDAQRVHDARPLERPGLRFARGGFELDPTAGRRPVVVRAANVLRQYDADQVRAAWDEVTARLAPGGVLVDATCDEVGRRASWVAVTPQGPRSLTLALRLAGLDRPGEVAERLPKALIHRNVPGERVHAYLAAIDEAWARSAHLATFGARQRWRAKCQALEDDGWPLLDGPSRWRLGELTVDWSAVAPPGDAVGAGAG